MQICDNDEVMKCPNCTKELAPEKLGSTVYWKCSKCGALWFDNKESDFLTLEEAEMLEKENPQTSLSQIEFSCPRDHKELKFDGHYFRCFSCGGVLTTAKAIVEEKSAKAKELSGQINRPFTLSQLRSVTIFAAVTLFLGINYFLLQNFRTKITTASQAAEIAHNIALRPVNNNKLAIYFSTDEPFRSAAIFQNSSQEWQQSINDHPETNHFLIIERPTELTNLRVRLTSPKGEAQLSEVVKIAP
jgi:Zn-finger nucleic acid-binding protein